LREKKRKTNDIQVELFASEKSKIRIIIWKLSLIGKIKATFLFLEKEDAAEQPVIEYTTPSKS